MVRVLINSKDNGNNNIDWGVISDNTIAHFEDDPNINDWENHNFSSDEIIIFGEPEYKPKTTVGFYDLPTPIRKFRTIYKIKMPSFKENKIKPKITNIFLRLYYREHKNNDTIKVYNLTRNDYTTTNGTHITTKAFLKDGADFIDKTEVLRERPVLGFDITDDLYIASSDIFSAIFFCTSLPNRNQGYTYAFKYWNGTSWVEFSNIVDDTNNFTTSGKIRWVLPSDWKKYTFSEGGDNIPRYWLKIEKTTSGTQAPDVDAFYLYHHGVTWKEFEYTHTTSNTWINEGGDYETTENYGYGENGIIAQFEINSVVLGGYIDIKLKNFIDKKNIELGGEFDLIIISDESGNNKEIDFYPNIMRDYQREGDDITKIPTLFVEYEDEPPTQITDLHALPNENKKDEILLKWTPNKDEDFAQYRIYRSENPNFTIFDNSLLEKSPSTLRYKATSSGDEGKAIRVVGLISDTSISYETKTLLNNIWVSGATSFKKVLQTTILSNIGEKTTTNGKVLIAINDNADPPNIINEITPPTSYVLELRNDDNPLNNFTDSKKENQLIKAITTLSADTNFSLHDYIFLNSPINYTIDDFVRITDGTNTDYGRIKEIFDTAVLISPKPLHDYLMINTIVEIIPKDSIYHYFAVFIEDEYNINKNAVKSNLIEVKREGVKELETPIEPITININDELSLKIHSNKPIKKFYYDFGEKDADNNKSDVWIETPTPRIVNTYNHVYKKTYTADDKLYLYGRIEDGNSFWSDLIRNTQAIIVNDVPPICKADVSPVEGFTSNTYFIDARQSFASASDETINKYWFRTTKGSWKIDEHNWDGRWYFINSFNKLEGVITDNLNPSNNGQTSPIFEITPETQLNNITEDNDFTKTKGIKKVQILCYTSTGKYNTTNGTKPTNDGSVRVIMNGLTDARDGSFSFAIAYAYIQVVIKEEKFVRLETDLPPTNLPRETMIDVEVVRPIGSSSNIIIDKNTSSSSIGFSSISCTINDASFGEIDPITEEQEYATSDENSNLDKLLHWLYYKYTVDLAYFDKKDNLGFNFPRWIYRGRIIKVSDAESVGTGSNLDEAKINYSIDFIIKERYKLRSEVI